MQTVATHNGSFDPDDVLAVAAIQLYLGVDTVKIIRSRDDSVILSANWVVDVGGVYNPTAHRFDHHQKGGPVRDDGIPYSAFGLIWKEYGAQICDSVEVANEIEKKLVFPIDAADNHILVCAPNSIGVSAFEFYDVIDVFKPIRGTDENYDSEFIRAVDFSRSILKRMIAHGKAKIALQSVLKNAYELADDKRMLLLNEPVSRYVLTRYKEALVIVSPTPASDNSNWSATVIPEHGQVFQNRVLFPEAWAGLLDIELTASSGIEGSVFCHKERYIFVGKTKAAAIEAANIVLELTN
ncbi:MAG: hypothetical protein RLZZ230_754 [Candidatus Parcubacteria bacterium]|jgi:uncharacterized UPF0160 family protein